MSSAKKIKTVNPRTSNNGLLGSDDKQTEIMWGNTSNTLPFFFNDPSYCLSNSSNFPPGYRPFLGWPNIFSIARHNSRSQFQHKWMGNPSVFAWPFYASIWLKLFLPILNKEFLKCEI